MTHSVSFCLAIGILSGITLLGCGEAEEPRDSNGSAHWIESFDCPRLEMESFDDCTYEEGLSLSSHPQTNPEFTQKLENFCASPCNASDGINIERTGFITDLAMLVGLEELHGGLHIANEAVGSLDGLQDLTRIDKSFDIWYSPDLTSIEALQSLTEVGQDIYILDNDGLENLRGLEALESARYLKLEENDGLESIEALESLESLEGLIIEDNPKLPTCQAEELRDRLGLDSESAFISGNGTGDCSG